MAAKIEVQNSEAVSMTGIFSWGLRVKEAHEWYYLSGHVDVKPDWTIGHPDDPLAQTRTVFKDLEVMLSRAGYKLDDVVKVDVTVTKDYNLGQNFPNFLQIFAEAFQTVAVKPSAGTLRVVEALAMPGVFIEIEMVAAK